jgi:hypothetical protein
MKRYLFIAMNVAAACMLPLGVMGFLAQPDLGQRLPPYVELPNQLGSVRVTAPDGRVFIASIPTGRVQRYGPDGFERGFPVDSRGGYFDIGVSPSGDILICSGRARALITYDQDGREIGERKPCARNWSDGGLLPSPFYRARANVPAIASSWFATLAIPLWHPAAAWLMALVGFLILRFITFPLLKRRDVRPEGSQVRS